MIARCGLLGALLASSLGCASGPKLYGYPDIRAFRMIQADPVTVSRYCNRNPGPTWDDGSPRDPAAKVRACWNEEWREMWVAWDAPDAVAHELCHAAGLPRADCARWEW